MSMLDLIDCQFGGVWRGERSRRVGSCATVVRLLLLAVFVNKAFP